MVPMIPRYVRGVGTMVSTSEASIDVALMLSPDDFWRRLKDVYVAIWARRSTVSSGNRTASSRPEPRNAQRFHAFGFRRGSMDRYDLRKSGVEVIMRFGRLEWSTVIGTRCEGIVQLGVGSWRIARTRDPGPWVAGVSIRNVRAVSIGARIRADSEDEMNDKTSVARGEDAVRMSAVIDIEISSSGKPTIAVSRLRMKVFKVGRRSE